MLIEINIFHIQIRGTTENDTEFKKTRWLYFKRKFRLQYLKRNKISSKTRTYSVCNTKRNYEYILQCG